MVDRYKSKLMESSVAIIHYSSTEGAAAFEDDINKTLAKFLDSLQDCDKYEFSPRILPPVSEDRRLSDVVSVGQSPD